MIKIITRHRRFFISLMMCWILVLEFFKFSVSIAIAQSVGTTVYYDESPELAICRAVTIPPFGQIPSGSFVTQSSCENVGEFCSSSGEYRCIAEQTPGGTVLSRFYCPSPGSRWNKVNTPCTDSERFIAFNRGTCNAAGGFVCVANTSNAGDTTFSRYYCPVPGGTWSRVNSQCTERERDTAAANETGVSDVTLDENIIGPILNVPYLGQENIECNGGTLDTCIAGALCTYEGGAYNWETARPSATNTLSQSCYQMRPFLLEDGQEMAALEQRCPVNASRCECVAVAYELTNGVGRPATKTIGAGQHCGFVDSQTPFLISRVFMPDGTVASRRIVSVPTNEFTDGVVTFVQDPGTGISNTVANTTDAIYDDVYPIAFDIINYGAEGAAAIWGEEAVLDYMSSTFDTSQDLWWIDPRNYVRNCSGGMLEENGYVNCFAAAAPFGLAAGAIAAQAVAAAGGVAAVSATSSAGGLVAIGVPLETAVYLVTYGPALLGAGVTALGLVAQNFGKAGGALSQTIPWWDDAATQAAPYVDEAITYGDDTIRVVSAGNELIAACAGGVSTNTATGVYAAAVDPLAEVAFGTGVNVLTSNPAENIQECIHNAVAGEGTYYVTEEFGN